MTEVTTQPNIAKAPASEVPLSPEQQISALMARNYESLIILGKSTVEQDRIDFADQSKKLALQVAGIVQDHELTPDRAKQLFAFIPDDESGITYVNSRIFSVFGQICLLPYWIHNISTPERDKQLSDYILNNSIQGVISPHSPSGDYSEFISEELIAADDRMVGLRKNVIDGITDAETETADEIIDARNEFIQHVLAHSISGPAMGISSEVFLRKR